MSSKLHNFGKPWWTDHDTDKLFSVLPEILRVVEAAEDVARNAQLVCDEEIVLDRRLSELGEALAR